MNDPPSSSDEVTWRDFAACLGVGHSRFFPSRGQTGREAIEKYCSICPVRKECSDYKRQTNSVGGVWGGRLDPRDGSIVELLEEVHINLPTQIEDHDVAKVS